MIREKNFTIFLLSVLLVFVGCIASVSAQQNPTPVWNLSVNGQFQDVPGGWPCSDRPPLSGSFQINEGNIPVTVSENRISASGTDTRGYPFTLDGSIDGNNLTFTIQGGILPPGIPADQKMSPKNGYGQAWYAGGIEGDGASGNVSGFGWFLCNGSQWGIIFWSGTFTINSNSEERDLRLNWWKDDEGKDIKIAQAIYNPALVDATLITLVKDREAALTIKVWATGPDPNKLVTIKAEMDGQLITTNRTQWSWGEIGPQGREIPLHFTPDKEGIYVLTAKIDYDDLIKETDETNNEVSVVVNVIATNQIFMEYYQIPKCEASIDCYCHYPQSIDCENGSLKSSLAAQTAIDGKTFMQAVYPVPKDGVVSNLNDVKWFGNPEPTMQAAAKDAFNIYDMAKNSYGNIPAAVAIVPVGYFAWHKVASDPHSPEFAVGWHPHGSRGILVTAGR